MNITSYNITEVSYHYIGLRVLGAVSADLGRSHQVDAISRGVLKFANDRALRLLLPEPRGRFETVGVKVCQELVHFGFAKSIKGGYDLTDSGREALDLLTRREFAKLRRLMIGAHLKTYDNLRAVIQKHLEVQFIWRPIVTHKLLGQPGYLQGLLEPTFGQDAASMFSTLSAEELGGSPKKVESALNDMIIRRIFPDLKISFTIFKSICSRLASLRLLNIRRENSQGFEFEKSYTLCDSASPPRPWYAPLRITLEKGGPYTLYLSEPDVAEPSCQELLLEAIDRAFSRLSPEGGYYDIPDVRDCVCEELMLPEAAFDDGLNHLLDLEPPTLSVGLRYQGISGHRKPLLRRRRNTQIYNLIRRL